jgi:hypothetical protein
MLESSLKRRVVQIMKNKEFHIYKHIYFGLAYECKEAWQFDVISYCEEILTKYLHINAEAYDDIDLDEIECNFILSVRKNLKKYGNWADIEKSVTKAILLTTCQYIEQCNVGLKADYIIKTFDNFYITVDGEKLK